MSGCKPGTDPFRTSTRPARRVRPYPAPNAPGAPLPLAGDPAPGTARAGAFTLVEVLMALMIFTLAAVVLGSAYVNVLNSYEVVSRGMTANDDFAFARQIVLTEPDRQKVEDGGEFQTTDGRIARWSVDIASTTIADLFNVAFSCELFEPGQSRPEKRSETFMLLRPTWSTDPAERGELKEKVKTRIMELQATPKR
jgi:general secretion pathway protein I